MSTDPTPEETLMPYQPDPALVRECARRIVEGQIEELRDLGQVDIGEMCEDEIVAIQEPLGGWDAPGADEAADALINAVRADIKAAVITFAWPATEAAEPDPLSQKMIDGINANPITRRAFTKLADAYEGGKL